MIEEFVYKPIEDIKNNELNINELEFGWNSPYNRDDTFDLNNVYKRDDTFSLDNVYKRDDTLDPNNVFNRCNVFDKHL